MKKSYFIATATLLMIPIHHIPANAVNGVIEDNKIRVSDRSNQEIVNGTNADIISSENSGIGR